MRKWWKKVDTHPVSEDGVIEECIYLSGPMTGLPNFNYHTFQMVWEEIMGGDEFACLSPHNIDSGEQIASGAPAEKPYGYYFRKALQLMLYCDRIVMLPGWAKSKGATTELLSARLCGMKVGYWHDDTNSIQWEDDH